LAAAERLRYYAAASTLGFGEMAENRHVRRRIGWERKRFTTNMRIRIPRLLVVFLSFLALALQGLVLQTHVHIPHASVQTKPTGFNTVIAASAGLSDVSLGHTDSPGGQYPTSRDSANCPLCKELTHSGQYVASTSVLAKLPFSVTANVIVFREIAPSLFAASHNWRGRAPPLA
jgi:ABC-type Fe3+-siderophore transport system permease subunit